MTLQPISQTGGIRKILRRFAGECLCDKCVRVLVESSHEFPVAGPYSVTRMASQVGSGQDPEFSRYLGKCDHCGAAAKVTCAAAGLSWA